jgi:fructose-1,6-bisphosphatase/inositol monophosphatase family enzyme
MWGVGKTWSRETDVAIQAARQAAEVALRMQSGIVVETKSDQSPVTQADRECEGLIARILSDAFPGDGILGEEGSRAESRSGRRWIIDPIDGTRDYVRGNQLWANLIALEEGNQVVLGIVNLPALGILCQASRQGGAYRNGSPMQVSSRKTAEESVLCFNDFGRLSGFAFKDKLLAG